MATYALIPGGGGDPWEWHRLVPELASRGHDAIAVRLPAEDDTAGWSEYADTVVDAIGDRARRHPRRRIDGRLHRADRLHPAPSGPARPAQRDDPHARRDLQRVGVEHGLRTARREYHASLGLSPAEANDDAVIYYHDLPSELRAEAQARTWQDQSMTPLDEPWPLRSWPDVPTRVLAGRHDRMFPLDFQRRVARERLAIEVEEIDGGHMVAMSNPPHWPTAWRHIASRLRARGEMPGNEHDAQQTRLGRAVQCLPPGATRRSSTLALTLVGVSMSGAGFQMMAVKIGRTNGGGLGGSSCRSIRVVPSSRRWSAAC